MENNTIHPDEMERLLRETFLHSPDSETDKISDMLAQHAYSTGWGVVPPVDKAKHFTGKKLFFKGFSLNGIIGISVSMAAVIGTTLYFLAPGTEKKPIARESDARQDIPALIVPADTLTEETADTTVNIVQPVLRKKTEKTVAETVKDTGSVESVEKPYVQPLPAPKPKAKRYVLIPEISAWEAAANEKRKQEMIRQVQKFDKKEWAYIPMGSTHIHDKNVSLQAFYMQTHEVSNIQYRTFLYDLVLNDKLLEYEKAAVYDSGWVTVSQLPPFVQRYFWHPAYDNYPVVNITLEGAQMYCEWLTNLINGNNQLKGAPLINDIRLPTMQEWVYAARANHDSSAYAWNGPYLRNPKGAILANYQSGRDLNDHDGSDVTAPVISYMPNGWGLYNMCGNVAEMTRPNPDGTMLVKGGAWNRNMEHLKIMHENKISLSSLPTTNVGFRVVTTFFNNK